MEYSVQIDWKNQTDKFDASYDRAHTIQFNGGEILKNTSAPEFSGDAALPNPEELFISSIASCFMLTFLALSANKGFHVLRYRDQPVGNLGKNSEGKMAMLDILLRPTVEFQNDKQPDDKALYQLFEKSHQYCFISNSVKTEIKYEPQTLNSF